MTAYDKLLPTRMQGVEQIKRDRTGRVVLPRIVERRPRPGDFHALSKKQLAVLLRYQPIDYLNGLRLIELRPRVSAEVGAPFGSYLRSERRIVLYSVPPNPWIFPAKYPHFQRIAAMYGASVTIDDLDCRMEWRPLSTLAQYMYCQVFLHELGHHHDFQYRRKRSLPKDLNSKEISANHHAYDLRKEGGLNLWRALVERGELSEEN